MSRPILTGPAEDDLLGIWRFISTDSEDAANHQLDLIEEAIARLAIAPNAGRLREDLRSGIRSVPAGNYLIFYRSDDDGVTVLRILHGARDLPRLF